jgi:hypothetical protein
VLAGNTRPNRIDTVTVLPVACRTGNGFGFARLGITFDQAIGMSRAGKEDNGCECRNDVLHISQPYFLKRYPEVHRKLMPKNRIQTWRQSVIPASGAGERLMRKWPAALLPGFRPVNIGARPAQQAPNYTHIGASSHVAVS